MTHHTKSALEIVEKLASSLAKTLMPDPDASLLVQEIGSYVHWLRVRQHLSAQELACQLDYDPSVVSKVERGQHISPTFIDKLLTSDALCLDDDMRAHLRTYRQALVEAKRLHRQQGLSILPGVGKAPAVSSVPESSSSISADPWQPALTEASCPASVAAAELPPAVPLAFTVTRWHFARQAYQPTFRSRRVLALVISSALVLLLGVALLRGHLPFGRYELGALDFNLACQQQFPGLAEGKLAVPLNPHNPFSWRCPYQLVAGEMAREGDMDTNVACREQYDSLSAWSELRHEQDANSWYCVDSSPPKAGLAPKE